VAESSEVDIAILIVRVEVVVVGGEILYSVSVITCSDGFSKWQSMSRARMNNMWFWRQ
jgi:hypothetical protein